ncbi:MAG: hypothetical protein CGU28_11960 [Candidatus Dactylopiibacterium carminicum]|nr:MAG: hypothetical protein CGU28_11960 [Candidatus Dactylopiibacterium carminicum]
MARVGLKSKLKRLEKRQSKRRVNRLALEYEIDATGVAIDPEVAAWLSTPTPRAENAPAAFLARYAGILNRRVMLCPRYCSFEAWETALLKHQNELVALARSRTNEPAKAAPVSVGTKREAINEAAPLLAGTKRGRFIELNDKRIFNRETGKFLDEEADETPGGLKAIFKR